MTIRKSQTRQWLAATTVVALGSLFGCSSNTPVAGDKATASPNNESVVASAQLASSDAPARVQPHASLSPMSDPTPTVSNAGRVVHLSQDTTSITPRPRDATGVLHEYFRVDAYQFTVPIGTLGRNEDFWKHIDEQCVDVGTYDLLFKNGLRVGVAPMSEYDTIRTHLDADASCRKISINGSAGKNVQLETRKDLVGQTIFYFDGGNNAIGRSYDRCTNLIDLSFEPTPRAPGSIRVSFAPEVRACRAKLEFSLLNEEREFQFVAPETFYDLNCRADIPKDDFLILAPSSDADRPSSVGHAFLTADASPQRTEQVIVLVPHIVNADEVFGMSPLSANDATRTVVGKGSR